MERELILDPTTGFYPKDLGEIAELHTEMQACTESLRSLLRLMFVSTWI